MIAATQPQLLPMALVTGDVVYTPDWVARDMVDFVNPSGRILEPCAGDGAFLNHLPPHTEWCEIEKGRDFFKWQESVDWIIGNPPYSRRVFPLWLEHSFQIARDVVYIVPTNKIFQSQATMGLIEQYGGIRTMLVYGEGKPIGIPFGFSFSAFHFRRGWKGDTTISFRKNTESA